MTDSGTPDLSSLRISREKKEPQRKGGGGKRPLIVAGGLLGLAALVFVLAKLAGGGPMEVETGSAVMVSPSDANVRLTASGYVVAQQQAAVASKGTGRLVYLGVEEGDQVRKNQVIARLEDADMIAGLNRARANLEVARAEMNDAQRTLDRTSTLHSRDLASQAELDAAQARFERVRAGIAAATAAVQEADVALENTRIRSPFDGTVLTKNADVGEVVAPFASSLNSRGAVVTVADMNSLQVEADVSESNIMKVSVGQPCEITLDSYPEKRYRGTVYKIVPTADRAKATVQTKVAFEKLDERVLPEMSAKVMFLSGDSGRELAGAAAQLVVPSNAVTTRNGRQVVFVLRDGAAVETAVTTGPVTGDRTAVTAGLTQGDRVILRPDPAMTDGTRVREKQG